MLYNDKELLSDDQDYGAEGNDTIYKSISAGLAIILGAVAYKKGYLQPIVKSVLEVADTVAKNGTENTGAIFGAIKDWTRIKNLTPAQMALQKNKTWSAPKNSIFRAESRDNLFLHNALEDLRTSLEAGRIDFYNTQRALRDTKDDLTILKDMISNKVKSNPNIRKNYADTTLSNALQQFKQFAIEADNALYGVRRGSYSFRETYFDELIDAMSLSKEVGEKELKRTGYRKLTLGDVLEFNPDEKRLVVKESMKDKVNLDRKDFKTGESFLDNINNIFNDPNTNISSKGKVLKDNLWENLIIDSALRIDDVGNIIDYRMSKNQSIAFLNSLAVDFHIPMVKFNPFKMLGFDKIGRKNIFGGLVSPDQYAPTLTGRAGQYSIGDFLAENMGEEYKNLPIAGINNKLFVLEKNEAGNYVTRQIDGKFKLYDITNADSFMSLKATVNSQRQMANLSLNEGFNGTWEEYKELLDSKGVKTNFLHELKYKSGKFLDLGNQEVLPESIENTGFRLDDFGIDEFTDKLIHKITNQKPFWTNGFEYSDYANKVDNLIDKNFKNVLGNGFESFSYNGKKIDPRMYYISKKGITLKDILDKSNDATAFDYVKQFFAGRDMLNPEYMTKNFNERSTIAFDILNRLSEGIGSSSDLLGFSNVSKGSVIALTGNFLLKRALPVYLATQVPDMINYFSEPFFGKDEEGNPDNLGKFLARNVVQKFDLGVHSLMDTTHITNVFKTLGEFTPGSDQLNEIPGIYQLGLGQTREEREEYIESGYDPMRKGRLWGSGSTPFTGSKIMYWRPNWYRRVQADVQFSDSKWGSRQEYYSNVWFPNPVNPLAPIRHFITDRYHYDEKHYYDRPYLETAPEGSNIPIIGPLFGQTIGSVIKPKRRMHLEYWQNPTVVNPSDETANPIITSGTYDENIQESNQQIINNNRLLEIQRQQVQQSYNQVLSHSAYQAKQITKSDYVTASGITLTTRRILPESSIDTSGFGSQSSSLPYRDYDRYSHPYETYITPSGGMTVVDIPDEMNLYNVNKDLRRWSINKIIGTQQRIDVIDNFQGGDIPQGNDSVEIDNAFISQGLKEEFNTLTDVAGLRGFAVRNFVTGSLNQGSTQIENSSYAYSFKKSFWDMNLGGLGGNLSEISRRFMIKRNRDIEYINPVRNTMPNWMPGSDYFVMDFKHGDPYSKIDNGEERLPGEGYERLNHLGDVTRLSIGSSYLGYSKEDIAKHLIGQEGYMSSFEKDTLDTGNRIHAQIESEWKEAGIALKTEGKIQDKQNNILGFYDAMIRDQTSQTGVAIVDIKTTSAKKLDEIRKSGKPLEHHQKQVNYYLWATNNKQSKGYIYYVDKENLYNNYMVGFDYSDRLLRESLNNLYDARRDVRDALDKGLIGRGDLYNPIDKVRILADVAPYSQEYKDALAEIKQTKIDSETEKELSEIHQRVTAQKEPLRVYDYKFKTSNVITERVTVDEIIDNNTIKVKEYGDKHAIKFAGIHVTEDNSTLYNPVEEEYIDKAGRKRKHKVGKTLNEAANDEIRKYIKPGSVIQIQYDADLKNKYRNDSTASIKANIISHGTSVNRKLLDNGLATEKENDDSPAAIHARYTSGEIAFGSAMERTTHLIGRTPFINRFLQVRSPYEQYKNKEVYGKDFQSWNNPISGILIPNLEKDIANDGLGGLVGVGLATYMGSLFGKNKFGRLVGGTIGFTAVVTGKAIAQASKTEDRDWRPRRRVKQEQLNEYIDALKYVKNRKLYEEYKEKALKENDFDVDRYMLSKKYNGEQNKARQRELQDFKRFFKLDFEHRSRYNFKYGKPVYADIEHSDKKTLIHDINKEIAELQSQRKVEKVPLNAIKAIEYKQRMDKTMFAYEPGDSLVNIMSALPKKERQYFKHFMGAPEEEKERILRIAPSYLRRALQSTWGLKVDKKPTLEEYFSQHALPDKNWIGWQENTDLEDLKVKLVHANNLDPGEFDIWENNERQAAKVNIPIPNINRTSDRAYTQRRLSELLRDYNVQDVQMSYVNSNNPSVKLDIYNDSRQDVEQQINSLAI